MRVEYTDEAMQYIREIMALKGITEKEAIAMVVNNYAGRCAKMVKDAQRAAERATEKYNK